MRPTVFLALALVTAARVNAQTPAPAPAPATHQHNHDPDQVVAGGGVFPAGWTVRTDDGADPKGVLFKSMAPGWHLTMGPAAILYQPTSQASGNYQVSSTIHLFPGSGSHEEAFGLFIGGSALDSPQQRYTYFLIRGDGMFKVKRRNGTDVSDVTKDWQPSSAITKSSASGPVKNVIAIAVGKDKVRLLINGTEAYSAPRTSLDSDGVVGLRVNHNLNLHVEGVELKKE